MNSFDRWVRRAIKSGLMRFRLADLREADLRGSDLRGANLSEADLRGSDLRGANLSGANLSGANLSEANLSWANLSEANLSGANGLLIAREWLSQHFTFDDSGVIVFKAVGNTSYASPSAWEIKPGAVLTEVCNPDRCTDCGCGVNFGTEQWVRENYKNSRIWRCRIEWFDLAGVVVPYHTDGKARCERLVLLEAVA